tara:strand:- start:4375 stop:4545 length:171 start_codon:yes stop_codon:yes gene_type:complete
LPFHSEIAKIKHPNNNIKAVVPVFSSNIINLEFTQAGKKIANGISMQMKMINNMKL